MNEQPKKKAQSKQKLTLHRETLRSLDSNEVGLMDAVVGGTANTHTCNLTLCQTDREVICPE